MQEYVTNAVVLRKDSMGDMDGRYVLFTERFGKIIGKTKSSRKITSKLAPHLEPGMIAKIRFIDTKGTQIIDALKSTQVTTSIHNLHFLSQLLPDVEPEEALWAMFQSGRFSWPETLGILGWDPEGAQCAHCGAARPEYFYIFRQEFFCARCASKLGRDAVISIYAV